MKKLTTLLMVFGVVGCFDGGSFDGEEPREHSKKNPTKDKCKKKPNKKKCTTKTTTVGAGGGSLSLPSGLVLDIPPGALDQPTQLTITATTEDPDPAIGGQGTVYAFEPEGLRFARAVDVTLPVPTGMSAASVYWTKLHSDQFEPIGGAISGSSITAQTFHFSLAQVGSPPYATPIRIQSFITYVTNRQIDLFSEPTFVDADEIEVLVDDGMGHYAHFAATQAFDDDDLPIEGEVVVDGVPTGGDYIVRTRDRYLFTTGNTRRIDLGVSVSGRKADRDDLRFGDGSETLDLSITGMTNWHALDSIEVMTPRPDNLMLEGQLYADPEIAVNATSAHLLAPIDNVGGGHLLTTDHQVIVAQLSNTTTNLGVPYEAMSRVGVVSPSEDMELGGTAELSVNLGTNVANDQQLTLDYYGAEFFSTILGTPAEPGHPLAQISCGSDCSGGAFLYVLGHVGTVGGFFGNNFDMLVVNDDDGVNFNTGTINYGEEASLPGDAWHRLFLARFSAFVQYRLPDTAPFTPVVAFHGIDWVTTPDLVNDPNNTDPRRDIRPPLSRPRNATVNGLPFYADSSAQLTGAVTLAWDPPSKIPTYEDLPDHPGTYLPSPVTYTVIVRRLDVNGNNVTISARIAELVTHDTSLRLPDGIISSDPDATYFFVLVADAGTTAEGVAAVEGEPFRPAPHSASVRTTSGIFGGLRGTP